MSVHRWLLTTLTLLLWTSLGLSQQPARKAVVHKIMAGPRAQEEVQRVLNDRIRPGDAIEFGEGTFAFTQELTVRTNQVTIRGQGAAKTTLSFKSQNQGKQGILVNRDQFALEDLTVEDTKGDGVKIEGAQGVVFRRVRAQWTGDAKSSNGAYGLYPVQCQNVLIEDCEAYGASDAGIYVGQSRNIIVRRCRAERNVAGIEIENSSDADVYENAATNNAGGLLVFDLPDLPVKNGGKVRVFKNRVVANNHPNFAVPGSMVASVAPGTGMIILCTDQVEVFENVIQRNQTYNLAVASYFITGREYKDQAFDPIPEGIYVHDNQFADGGSKPAGQRGELFAALLGTPIPDMIWDGISNPARPKDDKDRQVVFKQNGQASFANLNFGSLAPALASAGSKEALGLLILSHRSKVDRDIKAYTGERKPLPEVKLPGVK